jgi:hypothetical protein
MQKYMDSQSSKISSPPANNFAIFLRKMVAIMHLKTRFCRFRVKRRISLKMRFHKVLTLKRVHSAVVR